MIPHQTATIEEAGIARFQEATLRGEEAGATHVAILPCQEEAREGATLAVTHRDLGGAQGGVILVATLLGLGNSQGEALLEAIHLDQEVLEGAILEVCRPS